MLGRTQEVAHGGMRVTSTGAAGTRLLPEAAQASGEGLNLFHGPKPRST